MVDEKLLEQFVVHLKKELQDNCDSVAATLREIANDDDPISNSYRDYLHGELNALQRIMDLLLIYMDDFMLDQEEK